MEQGIISAVVTHGLKEAAEKIRMNPSAAEADPQSGLFTARLKPCPDETRSFFSRLVIPGLPPANRRS